MEICIPYGSERLPLEASWVLQHGGDVAAGQCNAMHPSETRLANTLNTRSNQALTFNMSPTSSLLMPAYAYLSGEGGIQTRSEQPPNASITYHARQQRRLHGSRAESATGR
jgi:hypothetical protein